MRADLEKIKLEAIDLFKVSLDKLLGLDMECTSEFQSKIYTVREVRDYQGEISIEVIIRVPIVCKDE